MCRYKHVVLRNTMRPAYIVLNVLSQSIGTQIHWNVLLVNLDMDGMMWLILVHVVICQEQFLEESVYVHHQWLDGMKIRKPVHVHLKHMEISVNHVQPPDNGTSPTISVFAQLPKYNGMDNSVFVKLVNMDLIVFNVLLQDIGIILQISVSVLRPSFGADKTVFVLTLGSCTKADVLSVKMDSNGWKIDVKNVTVHLKI